MSQDFTGGRRKLITYLYEASATVFYVGKAPPGSATSSAVWQISRYTDDGAGELSEAMAGGDDNFDNIWDNVESLSYL